MDNFIRCRKALWWSGCLIWVTTREKKCSKHGVFHARQKTYTYSWIMAFGEYFEAVLNQERPTTQHDVNTVPSNTSKVRKTGQYFNGGGQKITTTNGTTLWTRGRDIRSEGLRSGGLQKNELDACKSISASHQYISTWCPTFVFGHELPSRIMVS